MEKERKKFNWQTLTTIILAIGLISVTVYAINKETKEIASKTPETIYVGYEQGEVLENFTKEDAVNAMQDVLKSIANDVDGKDRSIEDRMKALDNQETDLEDVINENTIDKLYLSDEFKEIKFNRQFAASALLTYHQLIIEVTDNEDFAPLADVNIFDELVYLDSQLMKAHIPLDVFIGDNRGVSFEMQYIDGEWKFNPYTAMMSLVMVVNYEAQIEEILKSNE